MIKIVSKFDINTKPLHKAKPCLAQVLRDDSTVDWYEDCKAGQLLEIKSAGQKAYLNLDYNKIHNFNASTDDVDLVKYKNIIAKAIEDQKQANERVLKETEALSQELTKLDEMRLKGNIAESKITEKEKKANDLYDKRIQSLKTKYVKLDKSKQKNLGNIKKPILGFVCYEKEFNALPFKATHDSKQITQWLDDVLKNKKDFQAQRTEAFGKVFLWILLGSAVLGFIYFRFGVPALAKKEEIETATAVIPMIIPIISKRGVEWLKRNLRKP